MQSKLVAELLGSAQIHLPSLGFTVEAIQAGARHSRIASTSTVSNLFPNPSHASISLLQTYDAQHWKQYDTSSAIEKRGLRDQSEQIKAYADAIAMLESKLVATVAVKDKLPDVSHVSPSTFYMMSMTD
jgi:hypothetical protein